MGLDLLVGKLGGYVSNKLYALSAVASEKNRFPDSWQDWTIIGVGTLTGLVVLAETFYTVQQQEEAVIQSMGKFKRLTGPGFHVKIPFIENVAGRVSLRVQQLGLEKNAKEGQASSKTGITIETITSDKVTVTLEVPVQYRISDAQKAFYSLTDPAAQMTAYVSSIVRAEVPRLTLDDVFAKKQEIGEAIKTDLSKKMTDYGFEIIDAPVTNIDPDKKVREAMNEINAAERLRVAAEQKGEAARILAVKTAEGQKQAMILNGEGIAGERKAIMEGYQTAVQNFTQAVPGITAHEVTGLVLVTNYVDALKTVAANPSAKVLLMPSSPTTPLDIEQQIRNAMITAGEAVKKSEEKLKPEV